LTLDLQTVALFVACAAVYLLVLPSQWRQWGLFGLSILTLYGLQPQLAIRFAGFILPTAILCLTTAVWWLTAPPEKTARQLWHENRSTFVALIGLVSLLALTRYLPLAYRPLLNRPPAIGLLGLGFVITTAVFVLFLWMTKDRENGRLWVGFAAITLLFVLLKSTPLATLVATGWRTLTQQDITLASPLDWQWIGFSYIAFRLIHLLRDRQTKQLPDISLREAVTYTIFFPSFIAGPIDRAERFQKDWHQLATLMPLDPARLGRAGQRIAIGLAQKFIIADTLAQGMSLTPILAQQTEHTGWLWLLLYGYGFRLYFDFAGYTNMVIGLGLLFGIELPDNFKQPYLKTDITTFWQSWHITLSNWARSYVFTPLSRSLLRRKPRPSPILIVLYAQLATMILIGLWHGLTVNFLIWGIWHGLALFIHKQWSDRTRKWYRELKARSTPFHLWELLTWFITFHYVILGWVWFLLPDFNTAIQTFSKLVGL